MIYENDLFLDETNCLILNNILYFILYSLVLKIEKFKLFFSNISNIFFVNLKLGYLFHPTI